MRKDYYAILGVSPDADRDEIRRAFRRLARETHPDANPDDPAAEQRFREVAEAYEVLSDPDRRRAYDHGEQIDLSDLLMGGFDDLLRSVFGSGAFGFGGRQTRHRGRDRSVQARIALADAAFGTTVDLSYPAVVACEACSGSGAAAGAQVQTCGRCGGSGSIQVTRRSFFGAMTTVETCGRCGGTGREVTEPCPVCDGRGLMAGERRISVEVPAGVSDGTRLRLAGRGDDGGPGGTNGDLYVEIRVEPDARFERDGDDLVTRVGITMVQATLGASVSVPLIEGGETTLDIPPGTQPGTVIRLEGAGMGRLGRRGRGDLKVVVDVEVPTKLTKEEDRLLRRYAEERGDSVRSRRRFL